MPSPWARGPRPELQISALTGTETKISSCEAFSGNPLRGLQRGEPGFGTGTEHDRGAVTKGQPGDLAAEALAGARDDDGLAFEQ